MVNPVITPKTDSTTPVWERCLSIPGLHGKVPRFLHIEISYQDLQGKTHRHEAHSSWAALLQHECDHLDGIVYPMRMTDLSLLAYNEEPGPLAREVVSNPKGIDPLFIDLVERWPGQQRWFKSAPGKGRPKDSSEAIGKKHQRAPAAEAPPGRNEDRAPRRHKSSSGWRTASASR